MGKNADNALMYRRVLAEYKESLKEVLSDDLLKSMEEIESKIEHY